MKSKVFISGKIGNGKDEISLEELQEAKAKFYSLQDELETLGYNVINPFELDPKYGTKWGDYMRVCIENLMSCDYIYSMKGWENSKGAKEERRLADLVGIPVFRGGLER